MMRTHKHTNGGSEREPKVMHDNMHILFQLFASQLVAANVMVSAMNDRFAEAVDVFLNFSMNIHSLTVNGHNSKLSTETSQINSTKKI